MVTLGTIKRLHGFRGAVVIDAISQKDSALSYLKEIYIGDSLHQLEKFSIQEAAWMPKGWKVVLEEVTSEDKAKSLIGKQAFTSRQELKPTDKKNEFYICDLIGATAIHSITGKTIGLFVQAESVTSDQDRWWFQDGEKEFSIPATQKHIEKVDPTSKIIYIKSF